MNNLTPSKWGMLLPDMMDSWVDSSSNPFRLWYFCKKPTIAKSAPRIVCIQIAEVQSQVEALEKEDLFALWDLPNIHYRVERLLAWPDLTADQIIQFEGYRNIIKNSSKRYKEYAEEQKENLKYLLSRDDEDYD